EKQNGGFHKNLNYNSKSTRPTLYFVVDFIVGDLGYSKTKSKEEYEEHLRIVLQKREHKLYTTKGNCEFLTPEVLFLGHVISSAAADLEKTAAVIEWNYGSRL
ncbi:hypothetical protein MKX03_037241, partial [Papaver bracteatum]